MIEERILSSRVANDGLAVLDMNRIRRRYKERLLGEWQEGRLRFDPITDCPCGNGDFVRIVEKDRFGLPFSQLICTRCGLLNCSPRLSEESIAHYYDALYHPLNYGVEPTKIVRHLYRPDQGERIFRFVKELLPVEQGDFSVAEIGCGCGGNLELLAECCKRECGVLPTLYGCEFNHRYVEDGCQRGLNLVVGGTEALASFGKTFDVIIMSHVLEHFIDVAGELEKIKKLAAPHTLLFVEVPGVCDLQNKFEYACDVLQYLTHSHIYNFNLASLEFTLGREGYRLVKGNEGVQAVFRLSPNSSTQDAVKGNCERIIEYLMDLEANRNHYRRRDPNRRLHRRLARLPFSLLRRARRLLAR